MNKLIFLSHIHEERELAVLFKDALEDEFSGFVEVFVSSDGTSIPAGANFLKRIEDGLVSCAAALYLISPKSVARQWINFELGAVWIRNVLNTSAGSSAVPAIPVCHSGSHPAALPAPLNNLNGIEATEASQLEFAFRSIQLAMGGKGRLKTDFNDLATRICAIERKLRVGRNLKEAFSLLTGISKHISKVLEATANERPETFLALNGIFVETADLRRLRELAANELQGIIQVVLNGSMTKFSSNDGAQNGATITLNVLSGAVQQYKEELKF